MAQGTLSQLCRFLNVFTPATTSSNFPFGLITAHPLTVFTFFLTRLVGVIELEGDTRIVVKWIRHAGVSFWFLAFSFLKHVCL